MSMSRRKPGLSPRLCWLALALAMPLAAQQIPEPDYAAGEPAPAQPGQQVLNLKEADILGFINLVSEATGKNFVVDPRVSGKVTVISQQPLDKEALYDVFLSVLRVNGFAAVQSGSVVKIVPEQAATQDATNGDGDGDALVTRIIELKHITPAEAVQVLRPLAPQSAQLLAHPDSSSLVVADRAANVSRIEKILRRLDQSSESEIEVVPLENANATEVVRTLAMLQPGGDGAGNKIAADERTNSVLLAGDKGRRLRWKALIANLDTPLNGSDSTQVVYLRYADAEQLVSILETTMSSLMGDKGASKEGEGGSFIRAHKETNSLVITAPPAVFRELRSVIRQLDIRRAQVLIEAVIAEVNDQRARELGIQWQATDNDFNDRGLLGGTNFPGAGGAGGIIGTAANPGALAGSAGLNIGYLLGSVRLPGSDTEILRIGALAKALAGDSGTNVLSTPSTMTLDHQEAILSVGQEVPFLTGQYASTGANTVIQQGGQGGGAGLVNPFQTIDRKEVGIKLKVTPHINEGDTVVLDMELEVSSLAPNSQGAVDLITNTRKLSTRVMVPDNGLLVLGGLSSEEVRESEQRVPGLGSIPLVGNLFKSRNSVKERRNLMVFLKPTIARDANTERVLSSEKYNFMRAEQIKAREENSGLLPAEEQPLLPAYDDFLKNGLPPEPSEPEPVPQ